jgi:hypothetical protein
MTANVRGKKKSTTSSADNLKYERGARLKVLRQMTGLTIHELSKKYDLGASTIKYWECGCGGGITLKGAKKIVDAMRDEKIQCSLIWLLYGIGPHPQPVDPSHANDLRQMELFNKLTLEDESLIHKEIKAFCEFYPHAITLVVLDDGMEPIYKIGDSVGGKRLFGDDLTAAVGKNCIVETEDHQVLCRKLVQGEQPGSYNLYCINHKTTVNPPIIYNTKLLSAAPITRIWKRN